jgi:uncharacterized membrane protein YgdD (TMEM256/DUF423 family)
MYTPDELARRLRILAASGAALAACAVALAAYASHGTHEDARGPLHAAAAVAFGHGLALAALAPPARMRAHFFALCGLLLGTLLFSGGVVLGHVLGWPVRLAPFGGSLLILSWLLYAVASLRR